MRELKELQVTIVGLGLMGGSMAGALRGKCRTVVAADRHQEVIDQARDRHMIDRGTTDLPTAVREAQVVVLATPVRAILSLLPEIGPLVPKGCLLMDLGSTKDEITVAMEQLPNHVQPLGGHPMCGREVSGVASADPALFQDATFLLSPLPRTSNAALDLGQGLVRAVGARPLIVEPTHHDRLVAVASHLPYLLACALIATAEYTGRSEPLLWNVVGSGFRDTSRLAASDLTMMLDILLTNQESVSKALSTCAEQLEHLADLVTAGDEDGLRTTLKAVRERRLGL